MMHVSALRAATLSHGLGLLGLWLFSGVGCGPARERAGEVAERFIDGYWSTVEGVVVETQDDEMVVIDVGDGYGSLAVGDPFFTGLRAVDDETYTGRVATLASVDEVGYEPVTLRVYGANTLAYERDDGSSGTLTRTVMPGGSDPRPLPEVPDAGTPETLECPEDFFEVSTGDFAFDDGRTMFDYSDRETTTTYEVGNHPYTGEEICMYILRGHSWTSDTAPDPRQTISPTTIQVTFWGGRPTESKVFTRGGTGSRGTVSVSALFGDREEWLSGGEVRLEVNGLDIEVTLVDLVIKGEYTFPDGVLSGVLRGK